MRGNYEKDIGGLENEETPADDLARPAPPHKGAGGGFKRFAHSARPKIRKFSKKNYIFFQDLDITIEFTIKMKQIHGLKSIFLEFL